MSNDMFDRIVSITGDEQKAREIVKALKHPTSSMHAAGDSCISPCAVTIWNCMVDELEKSIGVPRA